MDPRLQIVFNLLPNKCPNVFIAGGAAVDYDKASDIDVFFCKNNLPAAIKFINDNGGTVLEKPNPYGKHTSFLVGEIEGKADKKIQVVVSVHNSAQETINDFDITTHMLGYLSTGNRAQGEYYTNLSEEPKVVNIKKKTKERYIKICARYGFTAYKEVIKLIENMTPTEDEIDLEKVW